MRHRTPFRAGTGPLLVGRLRETWLPRLLFVLTAGLALAVLAVVLLAPLLDDGDERPEGDAVVRRTAVLCGAGLLVTALVFFRPPRFRRFGFFSRRRGRWFKSSPPDN